MNLTYRKLAMLEKEFITREEANKINGTETNYVDNDFRAKIAEVLEKLK